MNVVDLFCGCGGFALGMERAGFRTLAAIDLDPTAVRVFRHNLPHVPHVLQKDLVTFGPEALAALLGNVSVDVIVGGPPCQGVSVARHRHGANHGPRAVPEDPRRWLYRPFLQYVSFFRPRAWVMETVPGMRSALGGAVYAQFRAELQTLGGDYVVREYLVRAWQHGVPQKRVRLLVIGVCTGFSLPVDISPPPWIRTLPRLPVLWDAIGDLPPLAAGVGEEESDYDLSLRAAHLTAGDATTAWYLEDVAQVKRAARLTAHRARPHCDRDLEIFDLLLEGETSKQAIARGAPIAHLFKRPVFMDRYTRQHRQRPCSTIVARIAKDGLMYIHPTQPRSLTPREAARVQSFPDWFRFDVPQTHQFRLLGNAFPPLLSETVGEMLRWQVFRD